ncbi:MAG: hypothetical protein FJX52_08465 [Alphaproteobacteria bacterium]|nr:hypothetical protein [Alphaproteobacteria bacterium]
MPAAPSSSPRIGHNNGPPLEQPDPTTSCNYFCWRKAHQRAWATPGREISLRRLKRAHELGMTYREYTAVILDRGVFL